MRPILTGSTILLGLVVAAGPAAGQPIFAFDLTNTIPAVTLCGGDSFQGKTKLGTVTDKAGNVFTLNCVNKSYFEGEVFVKATGRTTTFGRCVFDLGANFINYETDARNNFKDIEWVNVKPPQATVASRNMVNDKIANSANDATDTWLGKVKKYLKDNGLDGQANSRIYQFPFSPNDQLIGHFLGDFIVTDAVLTPSEADVAYEPNGQSTVPDLVIDPAMTTPGDAGQSAQQHVPEPGALLLVAGGLVVLASLPRARRRTPWRA